MMRIDSTVINKPVQEPSDNTLSGALGLAWGNYSRAAKGHTRTIRYTRDKEKKLPWYKDLVRVGEDMLDYARQLKLTAAHAFGVRLRRRQVQVQHYSLLIETITRVMMDKKTNGDTIFPGGTL